MSDLKNEMLKIKVKGYFDNGDLRVDSTITGNKWGQVSTFNSFNFPNFSISKKIIFQGYPYVSVFVES